MNLVRNSFLVSKKTKKHQKTVGKYLDAKDWSVSKKNRFSQKKKLKDTSTELTEFNSHKKKSPETKEKKLFQDSKVDQTV